MYSRFVPTCAAAPPARPSGRASSFGEACQGRTAPAGAGQGMAVVLTGGHSSSHRYLTVNVPFMFGTDGCTEHWYLYVPAGSAGMTYSCVPGSITTGLSTIFLPVE